MAHNKNVSPGGLKHFERTRDHPHDTIQKRLTTGGTIVNYVPTPFLKFFRHLLSDRIIRQTIPFTKIDFQQIRSLNGTESGLCIRQDCGGFDGSLEVAAKDI
jgi:hypothetical protein